MEEAIIGFIIAGLLTWWFMWALFKRHTDPGVIYFNILLMLLGLMVMVLGLLYYLIAR